MSFCSRTTAISNCLLGEHSLSVPLSSCGHPDISISEYSTSRGLSEWPSGMSRPDFVLSGPSEMGYPTDCLCGEPSPLVSASRLTDLLLGVYDPPAVQSSERMSLDRPKRRLSTTSGGRVCNQVQSLVHVSHLVHPIRPEWTPSGGGLHLVHILVLVVLKKSRNTPSTVSSLFYCYLSHLPFTPPELNPGHGHQNVADIRGGNRRNNSSVQLDHLLT